MKKFLLIFSIILALGLGISAFASSKSFITGYDVNDNCNPVTVERGIYVLGISLYSDCRNVGGWYHNVQEDFSAGIRVNGTEVISNTRAINATKLSVSGVDENWIAGTCINASTTPFAVVNPWGATAFVDKVLIEMTNGTTSITFDVGTSSTAYAAPSEAFMDDISVATSTVIKTINTDGTLSAAYGFTDPGTNSQEYAVWGSGQYINMVVTEIGTTGGVTGGANTFVCTYKIHSFK